MAISIDGGMDLDAYTAANSQAASSRNADRLKRKMNGLGEGSTDEELTEAVKSFEAYFVEQVLKEFKETENFFSGDSDSSSTQYTDMFMDSTISDLAAQIVDDYGGNLTEQFVEQMKMNYGISSGSDSESK
ncbi:MAG: hypothetical protein K6F00_03090 [Lachnospiraceae bacterium]|nr:hypothetical protein [Lachnospiraceae bacterium]